MRALLLSAAILSLAGTASAKTVTGSAGSEIEITELEHIILHPDFEDNKRIYISYVERDPEDNNLSGAVVDSATLTTSARGGALVQRERIWTQLPKVTGNGHYGHRMAFSPENAKDGGGYLYITSGERQKFTPSQNMDMNLGKVVRIKDDGSVPGILGSRDQSCGLHNL